MAAQRTFKDWATFDGLLKDVIGSTAYFNIFTKDFIIKPKSETPSNVIELNKNEYRVVDDNVPLLEAKGVEE